MDWAWQRRIVGPQEIFDAIDTIEPGPLHYGDLVPNWIPASKYLEWACDAQNQDTDFGFDAAVCYAKRGVCRRIDAFLICNHLGRFLQSLNYVRKLEVLAEIGLPSPTILHDLVIDPRNDIEHQYQIATRADARRAVELATLFLAATAEEAGRHAVISYGWSISCSSFLSAEPGNEFARHVFDIRREHPPMILIDAAHPTDHHVYVLRPKDEEALQCPLNGFSLSNSIQLAKSLRSQILPTPQSHTVHSRQTLQALRQQLGFLEFNCTTSWTPNDASARG